MSISWWATWERRNRKIGPLNAIPNQLQRFGIKLTRRPGVTTLNQTNSITRPIVNDQPLTKSNYARLGYFNVNFDGLIRESRGTTSSLQQTAIWKHFTHASSTPPIEAAFRANLQRLPILPSLVAPLVLEDGDLSKQLGEIEKLVNVANRLTVIQRSEIRCSH